MSKDTNSQCGVTRPCQEPGLGKEDLLRCEIVSICS